MKAMYWSKAKLQITMQKVLIFLKLLHLVLLPSYSLQGINGGFFRKKCIKIRSNLPVTPYPNSILILHQFRKCCFTHIFCYNSTSNFLFLGKAKCIVFFYPYTFRFDFCRLRMLCHKTL